ncbi:MAG: ABC transporter permease [Chloroherpetonaceae bacterium]|nr:ABC transporter permease [Chloroherpetonaceae bacterium]
MTFFSIVLKNLSERKVSLLLTLLSVALGVGLISSTIEISKQVEERFNQTSSGYELILGAKGSPLQIVLNTVYHLGNPTGNIPYSAYERYKRNPFVAYAIPMGLGDSYRGYRIICTSPDFFSKLKIKGDFALEFASGRVFESNEVYKVVVGSEVIAKTGLKIGDKFLATHGLQESLEEMGNVHDQHFFEVIGTLQTTNTPIDKGIYAALPTVWMLHEKESVDQQDSTEQASDEHHHEIPNEGDITAVILKAKAPIFALQLYSLINREPYAQAAFVVNEIKDLINIVGNVSDAFLFLTIVVILVAIFSVMISIYNSINERRREIAILRSLGATRSFIFGLVTMESVMVCFFGAFLGIVLCKLGLILSSQLISVKFGTVVQVGILTINELKILLVVTLAGGIAGIIPAFRAYRTDVSLNLTPIS